MVQVEWKTPGEKMLRLSATQSNDSSALPTVCLDGDFFVAGSRNPIPAINEALTDLLAATESGETQKEIIARTLDPVRQAMNNSIVGVTDLSIANAFAKLVDSLREEGMLPVDAPFEAAVGESVPHVAGRESTVSSSAVTDSPLSPLTLEEIHRRWRGLELEVIYDKPRKAQEQMQLEEIWAQEVAQGARKPTLRIWDWANAAVVIGQFQSMEDEVNLEVAKAEGVEVVRRDTGGGAMFIEPANTITYSLYLPLSFCEGLSVADCFRLCDSWVIEALDELGISAHFAGLNDIASDKGKIAGSAERRFPNARTGGALLHHTTMAYNIDATKMSRVLNTSKVKLSDKAVKSAKKRVDPLRSQTDLTREQIARHLAEFARTYPPR